MKKMFRQGWATKTFSKKIATLSIAILCSVFVSTLLSQGAFAATGSTSITIQSTDNQTYIKNLSAWASENVIIAGLTDGIGGNCKNAPDSNTWGEKECIAAYIEGYNDRKNNDVNRGDYCSKKGPSKTKCEKAYDGGAFLARTEARGATPDLSETDLKTKRDEYCLSKSDDKTGQEISPKAACEKGYNAGYKGQSKESTCKNLGSVKDDCEDAYDAGDALARGQDSAPGAGGASTEDIPCVGGPMGWVLCPIINYMADGIVALAGVIDSMMQFKLLLNVESQNQIQAAVSSFTSVANLILVIAFLVIIFSQTTSLGLSNYGIKRMLPRVIITAILINLSFYICAFAIDISNISGNAIMGFITGQGATNASISNGLSEATKLSGPGVANQVFSGVLGAAIGVVLLIMFLGPLALGIFITFVILVARQVILLFLVLVAPLAFAAWLLPNTESYFKKWKDLFVNMLVVYPMLMAIFGTALFAAKFISQVAEASPAGDAGVVTNKTIAPLIALLVLAIPLLALPFILKSSNAMLGKIANAAQKYGGQQASSKMGDGLKKAPGVRSGYEMMEQRKSTRDAAYNRLKAGRSTKRVGGVRGRIIGGVLPTNVNSAARESMAGQAAGVAQKLEQEEIANARAVMQNDKAYGANSIGIAKDALLTAYKNDDGIGIRAALAELSQSSAGTGVARTMMRDFEDGRYNTGKIDESTGKEIYEDGLGKMKDKGLKQTFATGINDNWSAFKSKDASITTWSSEGDDVLLGAGQGADYTGLTVEQLASQNKDGAKGAVSEGGISPEMAREVINSEASKNLTTETREIYEAHAKKAPPSPGSSSPPPDNNPPSSGGSSGGGGWNSGGGKSTTEGEIRFTR